MEDIKRFLFYSKKEKLLIYVAGYTDNSDSVDEIIEMLNKGATRLAELVSAERKDVKTFFVNQSRRYKNMRVFYVKTDVIPEDAFAFGDDWTMSKWISD